MRVVDTEFKMITDYDETKGYLVHSRAVRSDAIAPDGITKYAWTDEDFEDVLMYVPNHETDYSEPSIQDDTDAFLIDLEYRLTLLELGLT